jgi:hypothetical protein
LFLSKEYLLWLFGIERFVPPEAVNEKRAEGMPECVQLEKADSKTLA